MKIIRIKGGLGNQLFILNYALYLKSQGFKVSIDTITGFLRDSYRRYFSLNEVFDGHLIRKNNYFIILFYFLKLTRFGKKKENLKFGLIEFIEGYYQDKKYYQADIIKRLKHSLAYSKIQKEIQLYQGLLDQNAVVIHLRLRDYETISINYYKKAIEYIKDKINNPLFYVFTDDYKKAEEIVKNLKKDELNFEIISLSPTKDFLLMTKGKNFIIANSTFSFWASLLSENDTGILIAPKEICKLGEITPNNYILI